MRQASCAGAGCRVFVLQSAQLILSSSDTTCMRGHRVMVQHGWLPLLSQPTYWVLLPRRQALDGELYFYGERRQRTPATPCCAALRCAVLRCAALRCAALHCAVLCCAACCFVGDPFAMMTC